MGYLYLAIAIIAEVIATSALRATEGFSRPLPSLVVIVGYGLSFYLLSLVVRSIPLGIAYAIWSGVGICLVTTAGVLLYRQVPDLPAILGMAMIVGGVVVIYTASDVATLPADIPAASHRPGER